MIPSLHMIRTSTDTDRAVNRLGTNELKIIAKALLKALVVDPPESGFCIQIATDRAHKLQGDDRAVALGWVAEVHDVFKKRERDAVAAQFAAADTGQAPPPRNTGITVEQVTAWVAEAAKALQWELTEEQAAGAVVLLSELYVPQGPLGAVKTEASLSGFAGTGKTVLLRLLAYVGRYLLKKSVILLAPTGKAAARLREVFRTQESLADTSITTIHSALYGQPVTNGCCPGCSTWSASIMDAGVDMSGHECPKCHLSLPFGTAFDTRLAFVKPRAIGEADTLVLVDEGSMVPNEHVGIHLREEIQKVQGMRLIIAGDAGQLEPVASGTGGAMVDLTRATVTLLQIHRQRANTPVMRLSLRLRRPMTCLLWTDPELAGVFGERGEESVRLHTGPKGSHRVAAQWLINHYQKKQSATLLAYSNKCRHLANTAVRSVAGFPPPNVLCTDGSMSLPLLPEERVLVLANNHLAGMMNGEVFVVKSTEWLHTPAVLSKVCGPYTVFRITVEGGIAPFYAFADLFDDGASADARGNTFRTRKAALNRGMETAYRAWLSQARKLVNAGNAPEDIARALADNDEQALQSIFRDSYGDMVPEAFLWVTWGYCLTVHKSQGSQWRHVGLFWDYAMGRASFEKPSGHKLPYTAVSRAECSVDFFVPPS